MRQYSFSDDELRSAAASVRVSMLSAAQSIPSGEREFSEGFLTKMDVLLAADKRRSKRRYIWYRVAALFLACLVGASVWLAVDDGARAAFRKWVRGVDRHGVIYEFYGKPTDTIPRFELTWIPEGFVLESELDNTDEYVKQRDLYYENPETDNGFGFGYFTMSEDILMEIGGFINEPPPESEPCTVNGMKGEYFLPGSMGDNNLVWIDEEHGLIFAIDSTLDRETVMRIAESVAIVEDTRTVPPRYDVWWYPDGCGIDDRVILDGEVRCTYGNYETKEGFSFNYRFVSGDWRTQPAGKDGGAAVSPEICAVNGMPAEYCSYSDGTNALTWLDETQGIVLTIANSNLDRDSVMRIARSVALGSTIGDLPRYDLRWMPEGFTVTEDQMLDTQEDYYGYELRVVRCVNGDDEVLFRYADIFSRAAKELCYPAGVRDGEAYEINGLRGRYYAADEDTRMNTFVWADEDRSIVFSLSGTPEKDELLRIARDIVLVNAG